jgi:hypothetical protein
LIFDRYDGRQLAGTSESVAGVLERGEEFQRCVERVARGRQDQS